VSDKAAGFLRLSRGLETSGRGRRNPYVISLADEVRISGMNPIDLVITVCAVLSPATCEEQHLVFSYAGSPQQCAMAAPPYIAQWVGDHPKWTAVRWRCEYPHSHDRADAATAKPAA
jgi:hypothetical protein